MRHSIKLIFMTCILLVTAIFISCKKETPGEPTIGIEDISMENYPRVDGATATWALNRMIACKLLGIDYIWSTAIGGGERGIIADPDQWNGYPNADRDAFSHFLNNRVINSQTHGAFMNLIDGEADIIVVSSHPSPDEKAHAAEAGVTLIETPIAIDAFVFIVNEANPVKDLTIDQIRKIYTKQIINWSQVGGTDSEMKVFTRPRNSGSEETMRALVMGDIEPAEFPESQQVVGMGAVFPEIQGNVDGISYTFDNYKEMLAQIPEGIAAKIAVDGIYPDKTTIGNRTYPFTTEVYAVIRSDIDRGSMAYKLYEWMQTKSAKAVLEECGFSVY